MIVIEFLWPFLGHKLGKLARSYQAVVVVLESARAYSVEAPEGGWDGVETLTSK